MRPREEDSLLCVTAAGGLGFGLACGGFVFLLVLDTPRGWYRFRVFAFLGTRRFRWFRLFFFSFAFGVGSNLLARTVLVDRIMQRPLF